MSSSWPKLDAARFLDTSSSLQLWSQIVGKTRLSLEPMLNHWWGVTLYVTPRGLATPVLRDGDAAFDVELDLAEHALRVRDSSGRVVGFELGPMSVADFYERYRAALSSIGVTLRIHPYPNELPEAVRFDRDDAPRAYDEAWARAFGAALVAVDAVMKEFRAQFVGKSSPVHFFWGAFDLAVTRFSGRRAPPHPGGIPNCPDYVMLEAYSHEVSSAGFWPGNAQLPEPAFYSYAYPSPEGFADAKVAPAAAHWDATLGEFILPYEAVRRADDPRRELLTFLTSTYEAAANLAQWDRRALER